MSNHELLPSDFASLVGNDAPRLITLSKLVFMRQLTLIPNYSKVSDFVYPDRDQFDLSLFSPDDFEIYKHL